ncbi:MAG TPA: histidine kinase [Burkholderiaceae bacterium]
MPDPFENPVHIPDLHTRNGSIQEWMTRMRKIAVPALWWAMIGSMVAITWALPQLTYLIDLHGYLYWLVRGSAPTFVSAIIFIGVFSFSVGSSDELARRPVWFIMMLSFGSAIAALATWGIDVLMPLQSNWPRSQRVLDSWLTRMVFGGAFGWPALLTIQRMSGQVRMTQMLMQRSLLARKVAQASLFATRAQVDPELVVRVLKQVRHLYQSDAPAATALLDELIAFLRLAMNRGGGHSVPLSNEIDMMRGYASLRQAETGARIDLQIRVEPEVPQQDPAAASFFLLLRHVLRELPMMHGTALQLDMHIASRQLQLTIDSGSVPIEAAVLQRLHTATRETLAASTEVAILQQPDESVDSGNSGGKRYVVKAAFG